MVVSRLVWLKVISEDCRRLIRRYVVEPLGQSHVISNILSYVVPHSVTMQQKEIQLLLRQKHLKRFRKDKKVFSDAHHHYGWDLDMPSWFGQAYLFCDAKGFSFVDCLSTGRTIIWDHYCNYWDPLDAKLREKSIEIKYFSIKITHLFTPLKKPIN